MFHERLPLAGDPPNALLALPGDRILRPRDTPVPVPAMSPEEWKELPDLLQLHAVSPMMVYRIQAWPEEGRPPPPSC